MALAALVEGTAWDWGLGALAVMMDMVTAVAWVVVVTSAADVEVEALLVVELVAAALEVEEMEVVMARGARGEVAVASWVTAEEGGLALAKGAAALQEAGVAVVREAEGKVPKSAELR